MCCREGGFKWRRIADAQSWMNALRSIQRGAGMGTEHIALDFNHAQGLARPFCISSGRNRNSCVCGTLPIPPIQTKSTLSTTPSNHHSAEKNFKKSFSTPPPGPKSRLALLSLPKTQNLFHGSAAASPAYLTAPNVDRRGVKQSQRADLCTLCSCCVHCCGGCHTAVVGCTLHKILYPCFSYKAES